MSKRYTDTDKWKRASFRTHPVEIKLAWIYLCDACDHAGIWHVDMDLLNFQTGTNITLDQLISYLGDGVQLFDNKEKLWIKAFYEFQYGMAKKGFSAMVSAQKILANYDLWDSYLSSKTQEQLDGLLAPRGGGGGDSPPTRGGGGGDSPSIGIGIGIGIGKEGGVGETKNPIPEIWSENRGILPPIRGLTKKRKTSCDARWHEKPDKDYWISVVKSMAATPFLRGENERGWRASFDFLLKPDTHIRVMEGAYGQNKPEVIF